MTRTDQDPWRTGALEEFGTQLRALDERSPVRNKTRRRTGAALAATATPAAVLIAVILLAGGGSARASSPVSRAPKAADAAGSLLYRSSTTIALQGHPAASLSESGAIDFAAGSYQAVIRHPGSRRTIERRTVQGTFYAAASGRKGRRRWIAIASPRAGLFGSAGVPGSEILTDPPALLHAMSLTTARPRVVGTAVIDGLDTTEYSVTTRLAAFLPNTSLPHDLARQPVQLTVWIDKAGRPRRATETFVGVSRNATLTTQMQFSGFGTPVHVITPTANVLRATTGASLPDPLITDLIVVFFPSVASHTGTHPAPALPNK